MVKEKERNRQRKRQIRGEEGEKTSEGKDQGNLNMEEENAKGPKGCKPVLNIVQQYTE